MIDCRANLFDHRRLCHFRGHRHDDLGHPSSHGLGHGLRGYVNGLVGHNLDRGDPGHPCVGSNLGGVVMVIDDVLGTVLAGCLFLPDLCCHVDGHDRNRISRRRTGVYEPTKSVRPCRKYLSSM